MTVHKILVIYYKKIMEWFFVQHLLANILYHPNIPILEGTLEFKRKFASYEYGVTVIQNLCFNSHELPVLCSNPLSGEMFRLLLSLFPLLLLLLPALVESLQAAPSTSEDVSFSEWGDAWSNTAEDGSGSLFTGPEDRDKFIVKWWIWLTTTSEEYSV